MKKVTLLFAALLLTVVVAQATTSKTKVADVSTWTWNVDGSNIPTLSDNTMTFVDGTGLGIYGLSYAVASYDYLVVKVTGASAAADFTIDDDSEGGGWGRYHVTIPASNDVQYIKIPLGANTPQFNDGAVRAFSTIKRMWFKGTASSTLTVSEI